jgi:long-subunit fatty acid transport protein
MALAFAASASKAIADDSQILGTTPRAMSLAGAYTAVANDSAALYYNPAGLAQVDGSYIDVSFLFSSPNLRASGGPVAFFSPPIDTGYGLNLAWSPRSILDGNLGIGFSLQLPHQRALHFQVHRFEEPYFVLYENSTELLEIRLGAAYKFFDLFSLGVSALLLAGLDGRVTMSAPLQSGDMIDQTMRTVVTVDANLPNRQFFTAGAQFYPMKGLTLGVSYREPTFVHIQLPIDFSVVIFGLPPIRTVASLDVKVKYAPAQLNFGAAYNVTDDLLITADLAHAWYSALACSGGICTPDAVPYGNVTIDPRFSPPGIKLLPPRQPMINLRNLLIPRVGVEYRAGDDLVLRGGYFFFPTFIANSDGPILDTDKHSITVGATYAVGRFFMPEGTTFNLIAAGQALLFTSRAMAGYDASGHVLSASFGAEFAY